MLLHDYLLACEISTVRNQTLIFVLTRYHKVERDNKNVFHLHENISKKNFHLKYLKDEYLNFLFTGKIAGPLFCMLNLNLR